MSLIATIIGMTLIIGAMYLIVYHRGKSIIVILGDEHDRRLISNVDLMYTTLQKAHTLMVDGCDKSAFILIDEVITQVECDD